MTQKFKDYSWDREGYDNNDYQLSDKNIKQMKTLLDSTGKGFCLAKWTQLTLHLGMGTAHSCHHPSPHKIPLEELKDNPHALHNTLFKKERRKEMLTGKKPSECDFCWRVEDTGEISDRVLKSIPSFSSPHHDKIAQLDGDEDVFPTYVEVSFGHTCNFKCAYCSPAYSSQWEQEIKQHGPYDLDIDNNKKPRYRFNELKEMEKHIPQREVNPYIEAFWKWFPEAYKHMHTFRITGGEPLLVKDTWKILDFLAENPAPKLNFAINTNGCPPGDQWDKFVAKIAYLTENNCLNRFELYTSAEAVGDRNDYIRDGMDWELYKKNIYRFLKNTNNTKVVFMCAYNLLSISSFKEFLEWSLFLKKRFCYNGMFDWLQKQGYDIGEGDSFKDRKSQSPKTHNRISIDIPYIRSPGFLDASIATQQLINDHYLPSLEYMMSNLTHNEWTSSLKFAEYEILKLKRNFQLAINGACSDNENGTSNDSQKRIKRAQFYDFVHEYDKRRNKKFLETFPEYAEFLDVCWNEKRIIAKDRANEKH